MIILAVANDNGWPMAIGISVLAISICSAMMGSWPWEGIITHNHYHKDDEAED